MVILTQLVLAFVFFEFSPSLSVLVPALIIPIMYSLITYILVKVLKLNLQDLTLRTLTKFIATIILGTAVVSLLINLVYLNFDTIDDNEFFLHFQNLLIGDFVGIISFATIILYYAPMKGTISNRFDLSKLKSNLLSFIDSIAKDKFHNFEKVILYTGLMGFSYLSILTRIGQFEFVFVNLLAILYFALRYGYEGSIWTNLLMNLSILISILTNSITRFALIDIQLLLVIIALTNLYVGLLISDRRNIVRSLLTSEEFKQNILKTLVYDTPEPIVLYNHDLSRIIDANHAFEDLVGWNTGELVHLDAWNEPLVLPLQDNRKIDHLIERTKLELEKKGTSIVSFKGYHKNGSVLHFVSRIVKLNIEGQTVYRGSYLDRTALDQALTQLRNERTEAKRIEEELNLTREMINHALKMKAMGRLAGEISHNFNNVITSIMGYSELIRNENEDPKIENYITNIINIMDSYKKVIQNLLSFSKSGESNSEQVDLNSLIKSSDNLFEITLGSTIELSYDLSEDSKIVEVDPGQIQQIIINMLINAKDAMNKSGKVHITTRIRKREELVNHYLYEDRNPDLNILDFVEITIKDNGSGIPPNIEHMIFEPFFTTKGGDGTGLGLASAYGYITRLGGHITFVSDPTGTKFYIYIPISKNNE